MNHFNDLSSYLRNKFGIRVYKVSLDPGFGCPNRKDGGCTFCEPESFAPKAYGCSIKEQMASGMDYIKGRHGAERFIAFFQAGSTTDAPAKVLKEYWSEAVSTPGVVGLVVSTRPDCIDAEKMDLLASFKDRTQDLWLELGLQSSNENTLKLINRGHSLEEFELALKLAKDRDIRVCAHIVIGLPGESRREVIETARYLGRVGVWGVKIHNLHIVEGTKIAEQYKMGEIKTLELDEYATLVAEFIEHLAPEIVVHRLNAHAPRRMTIAPDWSVNKLGILNAVTHEFERRKTRQGSSLTS